MITNRPVDFREIADTRFIKNSKRNRIDKSKLAAIRFKREAGRLEMVARSRRGK